MPPRCVCQELTSALPEVAAHLGPEEEELLYGRAGLLYALLYTRRHVGDGAVPDRLLFDLAQQIIEAGEQTSIDIVYGGAVASSNWVGTAQRCCNA